MTYTTNKATASLHKSALRGHHLRLYAIVAQSKSDPSKILGLRYGKMGKHQVVVFSHDRVCLAFNSRMKTASGVGTCAVAENGNQDLWNYLVKIAKHIQSGKIAERQCFITRYPVKDDPGRCYYANAHSPYGLTRHACPKIGQYDGKKWHSLKRIDFKQWDVFVTRIGNKHCPIEVDEDILKLAYGDANGIASSAEADNQSFANVAFKVKDNFKCGGGD